MRPVCHTLYHFAKNLIKDKMSGLLKGTVHLILPVTKDRLSSLLDTQNDINVGRVKTCVKP